MHKSGILSVHWRDTLGLSFVNCGKSRLNECLTLIVRVAPLHITHSTFIRHVGVNANRIRIGLFAESGVIRTFFILEIGHIFFINLHLKLE